MYTFYLYSLFSGSFSAQAFIPRAFPDHTSISSLVPCLSSVLLTSLCLSLWVPLPHCPLVYLSLWLDWNLLETRTLTHLSSHPQHVLTFWASVLSFAKWEQSTPLWTSGFPSVKRGVGELGWSLKSLGASRPVWQGDPSRTRVSNSWVCGRLWKLLTSLLEDGN